MNAAGEYYFRDQVGSKSFGRISLFIKSITNKVSAPEKSFNNLE